MTSWRHRVRDLFVRTVRGLDLPGTLRRHLQRTFPEPGRERLLVLAFGKAARPMAAALLAHGPWRSVRGLVAPPEPDVDPLPPFDVVAGGHPLPTAGSLAAARRALELAAGVGADETAVFLVSGGGSALLEVPADPAVGLDELRNLYRALVGCGAGIVDVNAVRRQCSAVKGGRLAAAAAAARAQHTFLVADVPFGSHGVIASGPSEPDPGTPAGCLAVLDRFGLWPHVPGALRTRMRRGDLPGGPPATDALWHRCAWHLVQSPDLAVAGLGAAATAAGLVVEVDGTVDDWPYEAAAEHLLARLERLRRRRRGRTVAVLTGGELAVRLPDAPGTGGRNQQFALHCARRIRGRPIVVLSAGTDGIDGNSTAAGAVVDGTTMARARALGLDVHAALRRCDAHPLLHGLGDAVQTGPTGTNLRDLRLLVHTG